MKYFIRNIQFTLALLGLVVIYSSCNKGPNLKIYTYPVPIPKGMSPGSGYAGSDVTITGSQFGTYAKAVSVYFGGIKADTIRSCTDGQIIVKVPAMAVSGKVTLKIWTHTIDSIGYYKVIPVPVITSLTSNSSFGPNIATQGDIVTFKGSGFATGVTSLTVDFNGTPATIVTPVQDNLFTVITPTGYTSGNINVTINGFKIIAGALINPQAPGDVTRFYLKNYGPGFTRGTYDGSRWGTLAAPWVTNAAGLNKGGGLYGGYAQEPWNPIPGFINWETWNNTPVVNGIIYQPTSAPLPAGTYTVTFADYSEIQTNSSVYCVVAAGGNGIPVLANLSNALGYAALSNISVVGSTSPNINETKSFNFTLPTSQVVSIGFLGNMVGNGNPGSYFIVKYIKLIKD